MTTVHVQASIFTPPARQARERRRQVIAANIFSPLTAKIHPTPVSQPWQQAPRERLRKSSAGPAPGATSGQVAATRKGQGLPDQAKPTNTKGGHYFWHHFPKIKHLLKAKKI